MIGQTKIPAVETTDMEVPAIERGLLRLWHNDQLKLYNNRILELGCNESMVAQTLGQDNFIIGIDARPYRMTPYDVKDVGKEDTANFVFIQGDASKIRFQPIFDLGIAISSVEHFGCGEYGDGKDEDGDKKAMTNMWSSIKPGGVVMVTVPITNKTFHTELGYIRKYDKQALRDRIIQGHQIQRFEILTIPDCPDFVGGEQSFNDFNFSDITYKADIYLEMVKGG